MKQLQHFTMLTAIERARGGVVHSPDAYVPEPVIRFSTDDKQFLHVTQSIQMKWIKFLLVESCLDDICHASEVMHCTGAAAALGGRLRGSAERC